MASSLMNSRRCSRIFSGVPAITKYLVGRAPGTSGKDAALQLWAGPPRRATGPLNTAGQHGLASLLPLRGHGHPSRLLQGQPESSRGGRRTGSIGWQRCRHGCKEGWGQAAVTWCSALWLAGCCHPAGSSAGRAPPSRAPSGAWCWPPRPRERNQPSAQLGSVRQCLAGWLHPKPPYWHAEKCPLLQTPWRVHGGTRLRPSTPRGPCPP